MSEATPILNVMPDYGMGPFLWINRDNSAGVGPNCCDATSPCCNHPMSPELHKDFAAWVTEFERAPLSDADNFTVILHWKAFHARGMALARRLKTEVGDSFRIFYVKPCEDPSRVRNERVEIEFACTPPFPSSPSNSRKAD